MRSQVTISRGVCAALLVTLTFSLTACFEEKDKQAAPQTPPPLVGTLELKKENVPLQATYMGPDFRHSQTPFLQGRGLRLSGSDTV